MRIALISFEHFGGGIGTYVRYAAAMLARRGHDVEVFTAGDRDGSARDEGGVLLHQTDAERSDFPTRIAPVFAERHRAAPFDVIEGPEYGADAAEIARAFPEIPLVVKLHTPGCVIQEINNSYVRPVDKARYYAGGLRRGRLVRPFWATPDSATDPEAVHARSADLVVGPSRAILDRLAGPWRLQRERQLQLPNVFIASPELLAIPPESETRRVTFLGRLEVRKGVLELASAIPLVLAQRPDARFRFIGRTLPMPSGGRDVRAAMLERIGRAASAVAFIDAVPYDQVPGLIAESDICAYPSVWENFPNVCLEAMAAARGVIGSHAGGMAEIIEHGRTGLLVPPKNPRAIADAILELLSDPARRIAMGHAARTHVTTAYSPEVIGPLQEESYRRAIAHARKRRAAA